MRITRVEAFHCDAGWRPWTFVRVETDAGLVGWGECSDTRNPLGVAACVRDFEPLLVGEDPRQVQRLYWDMLRAARQNLGGISHKAIAGVELALWDITAKALNVPVYDLFGGPMRDRIQLYWSHCGTTRARHAEQLDLPPLRTYDDVVALGSEVAERGFRALKTNIVLPGEPARTYFPGFDRGLGSTDGVVSDAILDRIEQLIAAFEQGAGPTVQIALDLNYNFRPDSVVKIARRLERFNMQWLEYDAWDERALVEVKQSIQQSLASGESLVSTRQYRPFLELRAMDTAIIDVPWNGFGQAFVIGQMADAYERTVAPHNYYSHLADLHSVHFCAVLPNVRIMEIDIDDVAWKKDLVTSPPVIEDGTLLLPKAPGWGADIVEDVLRAHPWTRPLPGAGY
ncbi:MAG: mandelate racemase/muconate lactonizing enzyme family protein [Chloroflexota bacterium]|nr:mandelate racemase/muconate lactonizing enzyme family protein [Chloroflexota bacterium]